MQYLLKQKNIVRIFFDDFLMQYLLKQKNNVRMFFYGFSDAIPSQAEEYCAIVF
jgi:hypothetical protein